MDMHGSAPDARDQTEGSGLLIPLLPIDEGPPDAVAIAAWHLALSNLIGQEVPHDLLALWLFPSQGGVILLAPPELEKDRIAIPTAAPQLHQHDLYDLEQRVRTAGYRSVIAVPVRGRHRDLGLILFADLDPGTYGIQQALRLHALARDLVPTFEALAVAPPTAAVLSGGPEITALNAAEVLARVAAEARTGPELLRLVSSLLQPLLPHERLDVAVPGSGGRWALLSGPTSRGRWGDAGDPVSPAVEALLARSGGDRIIHVRDLRGDGLAWPTHGTSRAALRVRAVMGIELEAGGGTCGWLLVGGAAASVFRPADREVLVRIAPVVALRVQGLRLGLTAEAGQAQLVGLSAAQPRAVRLVGVLAATSHWGEAARSFEREVCEGLGYRAVRFVLRLGEDQVVTLVPGELRPLADLPREPVDASAVAPLLRAGAPFLVFGESGADLAVPLRIAGRPVGALLCLGGAPASGGQPVAAVQQVADIIAPHLELLRRGALATGGGRRQVDAGDRPTERGSVPP